MSDERASGVPQPDTPNGGAQPTEHIPTTPPPPPATEHIPTTPPPPATEHIPTTPPPPPVPAPYGPPSAGQPYGTPPPPPPGAPTPQPYPAAAPYGQPPAPYGQMPQPAYPMPSGEYLAHPGAFTNTSAIVLLVLSLLAPFIMLLLQPIAAIPAIVALTKQGRDPEGSRRWSRGGWITFWALIAAQVLLIIAGIALLVAFARDMSSYDTYGPTYESY